MEWDQWGPAPGSWARNHPSSALPEHEAFLDAQIEEMLRHGAIDRVYRRPRVVNPLGVVPKPNGKLRMILDMRRVNKFLRPQKFRMESLQDLADISRPGDFAVALDQTQGYYHVQLHNSASTFCGFEWRGRWYVYRVLPFGMSTAPRTYSKIMGLLVRHWRRQGIRMLAYLDDWLFLADSPAATRAVLNKVLRDCGAAHLAINLGKSTTVPTQRLKHLGFQLDLASGTFEVPPDRWDRFQHLVSGLLASSADGNMVPCRRVASAAGQVISMGLALGGVSRLFSRSLYADIDTAATWGHRIALSPASREELKFWKGTDRLSYTGRIHKQPDHGAAVHLACDASGIGWGGLCTDGPPGSAIAKGFFLPWHRLESSTHREMRGLLHTLESLQHLIKGQRVQVQVDNQGLLAVTSKGSSKPGLADLAKAIFWLCLRLGVALQVVWVPRDRNQAADEISKSGDKDDWQLNPRFFAPLQTRWGVFDVDRFATHLNHLVPVFFSRYFCPGCAGVDSFSVSWTGLNNWCNPPFALIGRVIRKLRADQAVASVVVPLWPGRPWWPLVAPDGIHWADFVTDAVPLPRARDLFLPGEASGNQVARNAPNWEVAVIRVDFRPGAARRPAGRPLRVWPRRADLYPERSSTRGGFR